MRQCSKCGEERDDEDYNASSDSAYCRSCQSQLQYSQARAALDGADIQHLPCPKYVAINVMDDRVEIVYRKISPTVWVLITFIITWSYVRVGKGIIIPWQDNQIDFAGAASTIPFQLGVTSVVLYMLFEKLRIVLNGENSEVYRGVGQIAWMKKFQFSNLASVMIQTGAVLSDHVNPDEICLVMKEGPPIKFGILMDEDSKTYIASAISSKIRAG
jgi:hypothetical protein